MSHGQLETTAQIVNCGSSVTTANNSAPPPFETTPAGLREMSGKYANAFYLWTWHEEVIEGQTVLSHAKDHDEGMSLFFATTTALEANYRAKGYCVKELSPYELSEQYTNMKKEASCSESNELLKVAEILKNIGAVELNPESIPAKRFMIAGYKAFNTKTREGLSEALDHLRAHGPLVGVYPMTEYQKRNADSFGILHDVEEVSSSCKETNDQVEVTRPKNIVCVTGFGSEDMCSFLEFQNYSRVEAEKGMFARIHPSSMLELVGLFVEEAPMR